MKSELENTFCEECRKITQVIEKKIDGCDVITRIECKECGKFITYG